MYNPAAKGHSIWQFLLKRVIIIIVVVLLCLLAYHTAKRVSNCTIMAIEAMSARVDYALGTKGIDKKTVDKKALSRYFTPNMISNGALDDLKAQYSDFTISGYNDSSTIKWIWSWPGSDIAHVRVTEKVVHIAGDILSSDVPEGTEIQKWDNAIYLVTLKRIDGKWLVDDIEMEELLPEVTETPALTETLSPSPQATETSTVTPAAGTE